jgi:predicted metal-dependent phosphoesterase TrpH
MLIDLHCHTKVYSACSALTPEALVRAARARGLDGVCITEHDALWPIEEIERIGREMDFVVLRGIEVTTEVGHVLAFGMRDHHPAMATLQELRLMARDDGALLYLAHPSRRYGSLPPDDLAAWFDSVEAQNGTEGVLQNDHAEHLARGMRLPGIGGSDAHSAREVGICATEFDKSVCDEVELLAGLRGGAYQARRV